MTTASVLPAAAAVIIPGPLLRASIRAPHVHVSYTVVAVLSGAGIPVSLRLSLASSMLRNPDGEHSSAWGFPMKAVESAGGGEARQFGETEIRAAIRTAISNASLPRLKSVQSVEAALGDGQGCYVCHAPISRQQYGYEIEAGSTVVRLHFRCFLVWYEESQRQDGDTRG